MSEDFLSLGQAFIAGAWSLFSLEFPGLGLTVGELSVGLAVIGISINVARLLFGFGGGPSGDIPRTSSTRHPKIHNSRKDDEF